MNFIILKFYKETLLEKYSLGKGSIKGVQTLYKLSQILNPKLRLIANKNTISVAVNQKRKLKMVAVYEKHIYIFQ